MSVPAINATQVDGYKLVHDTFKHLTTLSTGSILLLATLLKDLFTNPEWPILVAAVLVLFVVSTIASVIVMVAISDLVSSEGGTLSIPGLEKVALPSILTSGGAFLLAIVLLVIFALKNLHY